MSVLSTSNQMAGLFVLPGAVSLSDPELLLTRNSGCFSFILQRSLTLFISSLYSVLPASTPCCPAVKFHSYDAAQVIEVTVVYVFDPMEPIRHP